MDQKPSIGRIVHYVLPATAKWHGEHRPAVITIAWSETCVNLHVLGDANDIGDTVTEMLPTSVTYDPTGKEPRSWHWPERV